MNGKESLSEFLWAHCFSRHFDLVPGCRTGGLRNWTWVIFFLSASLLKKQQGSAWHLSSVLEVTLHLHKANGAFQVLVTVKPVWYSIAGSPASGRGPVHPRRDERAQRDTSLSEFKHLWDVLLGLIFIQMVVILKIWRNGPSHCNTVKFKHLLLRAWWIGFCLDDYELGIGKKFENLKDNDLWRQEKISSLHLSLKTPLHFRTLL